MYTQTQNTKINAKTYDTRQLSAHQLHKLHQLKMDSLRELHKIRQTQSTGRLVPQR